MNEYITYGFDKFDKEKFKAEIETADLNDRKDKPANAWWGSPIDAKFGWKEYCLSAKYGTCGKGTAYVPYVKWKINNAKIYEIRNFEDLANIPVIKSAGVYEDYSIDFNELKENGYDGIEICMDEYHFGHIGVDTEEVLEIAPNLTKEQARIASDIEDMLNTWDCDSICIWNSDVIEIIEEKSFDDSCDIWDKEYKNGILEKEIDEFLNKNINNIVPDKEGFPLIKFDGNEYYNIKLSKYLDLKDYDIFVNKDIEKIKEYFMNINSFVKFKSIKEQVEKIKAFLSAKEKMIEKAFEMSKDYNDTKKEELFDEKLIEEFSRMLFPAQLNIEDYNKTLEKYNVKVVEEDLEI